MLESFHNGLTCREGLGRGSNIVGWLVWGLRNSRKPLEDWLVGGQGGQEPLGPLRTGGPWACIAVDTVLSRIGELDLESDSTRVSLSRVSMRNYLISWLMLPAVKGAL